ncbi:hypothetical protein GTY75_09190 [Streptomyces sp. SID8381]|uniref:hypothetical protein n=1 Tax=unclassified Streptomyces TaxID=2593676 RepID=UPI000366373E|nr:MULTISPECIES: hypothetical protein [unclassified Streptomyces]MYX26841.1 hypothetical protein [Streptomyces sp. SID8381]
MSESITCRASRRGRVWVVRVPEHGVYGHGRTLKAAGENIKQGLALAGVTAEVVIIPVTPELEKLRAADDARAKALREAVAALALRRTSLRDIAAATGAPSTQVKRILAELAEKSATPAAAGSGLLDTSDGCGSFAGREAALGGSAV